MQNQDRPETLKESNKLNFDFQQFKTHNVSFEEEFELKKQDEKEDFVWPDCVLVTSSKMKNISLEDYRKGKIPTSLHSNFLKFEEIESKICEKPTIIKENGHHPTFVRICLNFMKDELYGRTKIYIMYFSALFILILTTIFRYTTKLPETLTSNKFSLM
jgi:hypothetical protein